MRRLFPPSCLPIFLLVFSFADAQQNLSAEDRQNIQAIIQAQLDAFQADDAQTAFSYASPAIQARFRSADNFMAMVIGSYYAVYRPKAIFFKEAIETEGLVAQQVLLVDQDDKSVLAIYPMERQNDGSWRIDGCYLQAARNQLL